MDGTFLAPTGNIVLKETDMLWIVGTKARIEALLK